MSKKVNTQLEITSFKTWSFGEYKITQYKKYFFVVCKGGQDIWNTKTLRGAVKFARNHSKSAK